MTKEIDERLKRSIERMKFFVGESRTPTIIIAKEAEMILKRFYGGFWRTIFKMIWNHWTGSYFYYRFIYSVFHRKEIKKLEKELEEMEKEIEKGLLEEAEVLGLLEEAEVLGLFPSKSQEDIKWVS